VAFEPGIEISASIEFGAPFFSTAFPTIFSDAFELSADIEPGAPFFNPNAAVFALGFELSSLIELGEWLSTSGSVAFSDAFTFCTYLEPILDGDDGFEIVVSCVCDFVGDPLIGRIPFDVNFISLSSSIATEHLWDFGDGEFSTERNPTHTYKITGLFTVRLTVKIEGEFFTCPKKDYITALPGGLRVANTNRCFRLAVKPEQGISFSELGGPGWIFPESRVGTLNVFTDTDQALVLVMDANNGRTYLLATRDGPAGSDIEKTFLDRKGETYNESEIPWRIKLKGHKGTRENFFIEHLMSHLFLEAQKRSNIGKIGYDAAGLRNALKVTMKLFRDGKLVAETETKNIPNDGDISVQKRVIAHELQLEFSGTASELRITNANTDYEMKDERSGPDLRIMGHHVFQNELARVTFWLTRGSNLLLNRGTGENVTGSIFSATTGPDGKSGSAMVFSNSSKLTETINTISGDFSIMFAVSSIVGTIDIMTFSVDTTLITMVFSAGAYTLRFRSAGVDYEAPLSWNGSGYVFLKISREAGNLIFSEDGAQINSLAFPVINQIGGTLEFTDNSPKSLFDPRIYKARISEEANEYYVTNVRDDNGNSLLPLG